MRRRIQLPPRLTVLLAIAVAGLSAYATPTLELLTPEESRRLTVENDLWRAVRPTESVSANLQHLRAAGVPETELAWFAPKLTELWDTGPARDYGWLPSDAVAALRAVDRRFTPRLRLARLRREVGIDLSGGQPPENAAQIRTEWDQALVATLEPAQVAEFTLCNSPSAVRARDRLAGVKLTVEERRQVYLWEREFDETARAAQDAHYWTARIEHWARLRSLLGDIRTAHYARAAESDFAAQQRALGADDSTALDCWRILESLRRDLAASLMSGQTPAAHKAHARAAIETIIGAEPFARYHATPEGRWLGAPPQRVNAPAR